MFLSNLRPKCPPFHYSIVPPFRPDADRAKQSQFTRRCRAQLYKRTQFLPPMPIRRSAFPGGANAPNKPKLGQAGASGGWHVRIPLCRTCETNPILRLRIAPNKPNSRRAGPPTLVDRAKRTQFLPLCRSGDRRSREGQMRQTKPNLGKLGYLGHSAPGRGQSYKQTQFGEESQVLRRARPWSGLQTSNWVKGRSCKTPPLRLPCRCEDAMVS
jgi:hypothetical protein